MSVDNREKLAMVAGAFWVLTSFTLVSFLVLILMRFWRQSERSSRAHLQNSARLLVPPELRVVLQKFIDSLDPALLLDGQGKKPVFSSPSNSSLYFDWAIRLHDPLPSSLPSSSPSSSSSSSSNFFLYSVRRAHYKGWCRVERRRVGVWSCLAEYEVTRNNTCVTTGTLVVANLSEEELKKKGDHMWETIERNLTRTLLEGPPQWDWKV